MASSPSRLPRDSEEIEATAAVWLSLRDRGMSEAETSEFVRWLQQDPQHAEVFSELDAIWKDCSRLAAVLPTGAVADPELPVPRRRRRSRHWLAIGSLAAAVAFLVAYPSWRREAPPHPTAETAVGAFQKLDLPDGSVVQLNTDSALDVHFSTGERRVRLVRGEAHFTVATNPARPFIVSAGAVDVRAVGTAFNVRLRSESVEVLVTEGRVGVGRIDPKPDSRAGGGPFQLIAGERAIVPVIPRSKPTAPLSAIVAAIPPLEIERALAWQERRLEFDAMALGEVVAEFNRYNRCQLVIADPRLAQKRFSGTFRADGYAPFVRLLEESFGVAVTRREGEILLRIAP